MTGWLVVDAMNVVGVALVWAGGGPDAADDRIVTLLGQEGAAATVVTADRRRRDRVRARGAKVEGPQGFLRRLEGT